MFTMFHAITGWDNASFFVNKGKKSAMKTWVVPDYADNSLLKMMQNPTNISDEDVLNIVKFVILMLAASINNARLELFAAKNRTLKNIPPTRASLIQHICRSALQANC